MCRGTNHKSLPQSANVANAKSRSTSCEADISVPCDCHGNSHSLVVGCTSPDGAIAVQGARQCGVHRQPDPSEQPIDSTSASFGCDGCVEVQVTQQHVCTHTATASADSSHLSPEQTPLLPRPLPVRRQRSDGHEHRVGGKGGRVEGDATRGGGNGGNPIA